MPAFLATAESRTPLKRKRNRRNGRSGNQPSDRLRGHRSSSHERLSLYGKDSPHSAAMLSMLASPELEPQLEPTAGGNGSHGGGPRPAIATTFAPPRACLKCLRWQGVELLHGRDPTDCEERSTSPGSCTRCVDLDQDCIWIPNDLKSRSLEKQLHSAHDALRAGRYDVRRHGCLSQLWEALNAHIHIEVRSAEGTEEILARLRRELQESELEEFQLEEPELQDQQMERGAEVMKEPQREELEQEEIMHQAQAGMRRALGVREQLYVEPREQAVSVQGMEEEYQQQQQQQQQETPKKDSETQQPKTPEQDRGVQPRKEPQSASQESNMKRHDSVTDNAGLADVLIELRLMRQDMSEANRLMVAALHSNTAVMSELLGLLKHTSS